MTWQSQIIELLTASLIRPVALAGAAWLILRLYKVRHPASRHAVWTAVLIGMMLLPLVSVFAPQWKLPLLPEKPEIVPQAQVQRSDDIAEVESSDVRLNSVASHPLQAAKFAWPSPQTPIVWCYFAGVLAVVVFRLTGWALLLRVLSKSRALRTRLFESSEVITPVTVGVLQPSVILPAGWRGWNANTKRAVLAHEFAHIRRRDTLTSSLCRFAKCIYWFHPLAWWISRQIADLAELSCDAVVLEKNGDPGGYSRILLGFAETVHAAGYRAVLPGLAIASRSGMGHRIDQVFELAGGNLRRLSRPGTVLALMGLPVMCLAAVVGLTAPATHVLNQATAAVTPSQPIVLAQLQQPVAQPAPQFEVASIKLCKDGDFTPGRGGGGGFRLSPGSLIVNCETIASLIPSAYLNSAERTIADPHFVRLLRQPVRGGPSWIDTDRYRIEAKAEGSPNNSMMTGPMMRALLESRFQLKTHRETKQVPIYALTVARGGPRLQAVQKGSCIVVDRDHPFSPPEGGPMPRVCGGVQGTSDGLTTYGQTMTGLCYQLQGRLDREVVDGTGIPGMFDIHLEAPRGYFFAEAPSDAAPPDPADIFAAFQRAVQKLGLKLDRAMGSDQFLVVDHVERPTEN